MNLSIEHKKIYDETFSNMIYTSYKYVEYNFYAHLLSQCTVEVSETLPAPAGVYFNETRFVLTLNLDLFSKYTLMERLAIIKHEMLHILTKTSLRKAERDHKIFNIASDCAINQLINPDHLPNGCVNPISLSEMLGIEVPVKKTSEFYYDLIIKNNPQIDESKMTQIDDHSGLDSLEDSEIQELQKNIISKMLDVAIERSRGDIPGELKDIISLMKQPAKVSWKKVLNNMLGNKNINLKPTIKRPNRRFQDREDLRGSVKDSMFDLIVILDVSGSMSSDDINKGLAEITKICKIQNTTLRLIQVDSKVQEIGTFNHKTSQFKRKGFGGTIMYPAIEYLISNKIQFDGIVLITDGFIEDISTWKIQPKKPIIFLTTDKEIKISNKFYKQFKL